MPVAEGGASLDVANGQAVCGECHKTKTAAEAYRGRVRRSRFRPPVPHPGRVNGTGRTGTEQAFDR